MNREPEPEIEEFNPQAWMITFSDMVSLLLTFFVMLLAMSSLDDERLKESFKFFLGALGPLEKGEMSPVSQMKVTDDQTVVMPQFYESIKMAMGQKKDDDLIKTARPKSSKADDATEPDFTTQQRGLTFRLPCSTAFKPGSVELQPESRDTVIRMCRLLRSAPFPIRVEGHTDSLPIHTGKYPSNWDLAMDRALGVVKVMQEQGGIAPERLAAISYGRSRPRIPNETAEQREKNRRIEIVILREKGVF